MSWKVLMVLRVPRTIMAVTAGAGLAFAGSVYQLLFRNPLAAPDIIGVSSGASVGASVSILFFGGGLLTNTLLAFTGGLTAVGLALLLAWAATGAIPPPLYWLALRSTPWRKPL